MASSEEFFAKYDERVTDALERYHVPGISVAVISGASTYTKGYGHSRLPSEHVTPSTLFNAASMTKANVAAALSILIDTHQPRITWQTPVSQLIRDDFVLSDAHATATVTLEDILSHRSGMPDIDDACLGVDAAAPDSVLSVVRKLRHLPLTAQPRTTFQYCNAMFVVAVHVIETLTGAGVDEFLQERLWRPLGMHDTYSELERLREHGADALARLSHGFGWDDEASEYFVVPWPHQPEAIGAGEMLTTAGDYARLMRCLIERSAPLSKEGHDELARPRTIVGNTPKPGWSPELYALGLETSNYRGERVVGHDGCTSGFACSMMFLPDKGWGVVILGNTSDAQEPIYEITSAMLGDFLDVPAGQRFDWDAYWTKQREEDKPQTVESLYPNLPVPALPPALPIEQYAGSYYSKGYETWVVELKEGGLEIDARDRTWPSRLLFSHVSGEHFVVEWTDLATRFIRRVKAQFRIGADGKVEQLGLPLLDEDEKGELGWLRRLHSEGHSDGMERV